MWKARFWAEMHIKEDDPRLAVVEKFFLFATGWGTAIMLAFSFYRFVCCDIERCDDECTPHRSTMHTHTHTTWRNRWRQRKYWTVRQGYLDALDQRAKEGPLTREERALRKAIAAEQQQNIRWKPKDADAVMNKSL